MMMDWKRVARTAIQSASGAGIALITSIAGNFDKGVILASVLQFGCTVLLAVLMNINKQAKENDEDGDSDDV